MTIKKFLPLLLSSLMVYSLILLPIISGKSPVSCDGACTSTPQCNKICTSKGYKKGICHGSAHLFYICCCYAKFESQYDPSISSPPNY
ncbi:Defensin-like protein 81 [Arabidopsis thaliana]|uniref:Defensin-like protein 81 n=5 Tax=Arabidopsis TaxID=3701 RepID=DEF81_ARATH|nr:Protein of unknown function (PD694200) [Arabidopsis thaliana]Q2V4G6.1 RecName: Full=Defensin-like protein 81; Flags: Precursor [Arabidopsis thaliana]KAG7649824.1 hypothetical protein ISN45_At01g048330 [Arabidopsis thaliana x Arabidopsis arenosa]KAG7657694.1 hypothetical protein ISN44_As01g047330 [Arabidopsis suecica]ABI34015.1 unknown [Arabidopsis thaliana]AEE33367.1 Protein of unknown function (PD694200) [Arabidopsis thaliana]OAP17685.1 hypothetical protein AXX17_AT1G50920 [Arabidopsis th|eukprot:NP_001031198.1 Protein of unknown function (PD694200) [Arabidopsis thaliana]